MLFLKRYIIASITADNKKIQLQFPHKLSQKSVMVRIC